MKFPSLLLSLLLISTLQLTFALILDPDVDRLQGTWGLPKFKHGDASLCCMFSELTIREPSVQTAASIGLIGSFSFSGESESRCAAEYGKYTGSGLDIDTKSRNRPFTKIIYDGSNTVGTWYDLEIYSYSVNDKILTLKYSAKEASRPSNYFSCDYEMTKVGEVRWLTLGKICLGALIVVILLGAICWRQVVRLSMKVVRHFDREEKARLERVAQIREQNGGKDPDYFVLP